MSLYGLMIEFKNPESLLKAAHTARQAGYHKLDAYTPFPIDGLAEALGFKKDRVAMLTLLGGLIGCVGGFFMQWYANVIDYPLNVAGRPYNSWPAFIPITFELTVLGASLAAAIGMMVMNRLPEPWHPVFNHPDFVRASRDRFFLCIEADDPLFNASKIRDQMNALEPLNYCEVDDGE